jgi:hypothetical protein
MRSYILFRGTNHVVSPHVTWRVASAFSLANSLQLNSTTATSPCRDTNHTQLLKTFHSSHQATRPIKGHGSGCWLHLECHSFFKLGGTGVATCVTEAKNGCQKLTGQISLLFPTPLPATLRRKIGEMEPLPASCSRQLNPAEKGVALVSVRSRIYR